jgi:hypothetical protein
MSKIIGNTTATPNPRPDWEQTDETKADYIKNKPTILTEEDVVGLIAENGGGGGSVNQIQSDWEQTDDTQVDYIKNKPDVSNGYKKTVSFSGLYKIEDMSPIQHTAYFLTDFYQNDVFYIIPHNFATSTYLRSNESVEILIPPLSGEVLYFGGESGSEEYDWEIINKNGEILTSGTTQVGIFHEQVTLTREAYKLIIYVNGSAINRFYVSFDYMSVDDVPYAQPLTVITNYDDMDGKCKWESTITYKDGFYIAGVCDTTASATFTYNADINIVIDTVDQKIPSDVVMFTKQSLTESQQAQARANIGVGTSSFSGSYNDLTDKPTIPNALADLTDDETHRTVTDTEKSTWNGKSDFDGDYNSLKNIPYFPNSLGEFVQTPEYRTVTDDEKVIWNGKSDFDGDYNSLTNKPTIPSTEGLATTDYVDTKVAAMVDSAPETLDTLNELAAALGDDPNFATTIATQIGNKADTSYVDEKIGDIETVLENIIATQNSYIPHCEECGGTYEVYKAGHYYCTECWDSISGG